MLYVERFSPSLHALFIPFGGTSSRSDGSIHFLLFRGRKSPGQAAKGKGKFRD